jgi:hypothetical protein
VDRIVAELDAFAEAEQIEPAVETCAVR